jgi:hypothetical protein
MGLAGRHELKYVVEEARAVAIREFLRAYLRPSIYNRAGPQSGEPVISLYLDSPDLALYRQSAGGLKNRVKLRIRFYDADWGHPAYLEVKRRVGDMILKERAMVSRESVRRMLSGGPQTVSGGVPNPGYWPDRTDLLNGSDQGGAQQFFFHLCGAVGARGMVYVSYLREAWESDRQGLVRVTLDRHIRGTLYDGTARLAIPARGSRPELPYFPRDGVVLELKFSHGSPRWLPHLLQGFDLVRRSVSKYCACVEAVGLHRGVSPFGRPQEEVLQ